MLNLFKVVVRKKNPEIPFPPPTMAFKDFCAAVDVFKPEAYAASGIRGVVAREHAAVLEGELRKLWGKIKTEEQIPRTLQNLYDIFLEEFNRER